MHSASYYLELLLSGITVGSLYALIAIGYTMVRHFAPDQFCTW